MMTMRNEKIRCLCVEWAARGLNMAHQNILAATTFTNILAAVYDPMRIDQPDAAYAGDIANGLHQLYGYDDDIAAQSHRSQDEAVRAWMRFIDAIGYEAARLCDRRTFEAVEIMRSAPADRHAKIYNALGSPE
jgi:hypothetical protein